MNHRERSGLVIVALALVAAALPVPGAISAQEGGRFRVLVPDFVPEGDGDRRFGQRTAERVAKLFEAYDTHQPVAAREYRDALRKFKLSREDVGCIEARQLAPQINAQLVVCGSYAPSGDQWAVTTTVWTVPGQESFEIQGTAVPTRNGEDAAAAHINERFGVFVQQDRLAFFCKSYYDSQQWDQAMSNCNQALELSPGARGPLMVRGLIFREQSDFQSAIRDFETVLAGDPYNQSALQNAAFAAAQIGDREKSLGYYQEYLELDPDNARVRMQIAYELATDGNDPAGAVTLLAEGVERDPENVDLLERLGGAAFLAATRAEGTLAADAEIPAEARQFYQTAIDAYSKVLDVKGAEADATAIGSAINAYIKLGDLGAAQALGNRALEQKGDSPDIWQAVANVQQRAGDLTAAVASLDRVKELDPERKNLAAMQGQWLIQSGQYDQGATYLKEAVTRGEQTAEAMAQFIWGRAISDGINQGKDLALGLRLIDLARTMEPQDAVMRSQLDFWQGVAMYLRGVQLEAPQTLQTAQQTLPMFQEAIRLLQAGTAYARSPQGAQAGRNHQQYLNNAQQYIEIQDAIIKRGR